MSNVRYVGKRSLGNLELHSVPFGGDLPSYWTIFKMFVHYPILATVPFAIMTGGGPWLVISMWIFYPIFIWGCRNGWKKEIEAYRAKKKKEREEFEKRSKAARLEREKELGIWRAKALAEYYERYGHYPDNWEHYLG